MPKIYFFLILLIICHKCFAQNNIAITSIIDTIEKHHIGYKYFFSKNKAYNRFKQNIIKKTGKELNVQASFILSEYLNFYKDNHSFYYISDSSIRQYKNFVSKRLNNDLIGLWKDLYSDVEYQIVKKENGDLCFAQIAGNDSMKIIRYDETGFATVLEFRKKFYITGFQLKKGIIYRSGKPFLKRINSISSSYKRQTRVFAGFIQKKFNDSVYLLRIGNLRRNYINTYDSII